MDLSKEDFKKLLEIFKIESEEHIQKLNTGILALEENPSASGLCEEVFREAHSLKGAARMLNFVSIENIAHQLETLLGKIKKEEMTLTHETTNLILKSVDTIESIINSLSQGDEEDEEDHSSLLDQLAQAIKGNAPVNEPENDLKNTKTPQESDIIKAPLEENNSENNRDLNLFLQETGEAHQELVKSLLNIEKNTDDKKEIQNAFEQAHALKGSGRIINNTEMGDISFSIERALQAARDNKIQVTSQFITLLLKGVDIIKTFIDQIEAKDKTKVPPDFNQILLKIDSLATKPLSSQKLEKKSIKKPKPLVKEKLIDKKNGVGPGSPKSAGSIKPRQTSPVQSKNTVRISSEKLDRLIEQAGELLVMKLKSHQRLQDIQTLMEECNLAHKNIKKRSRQLNRRKLQNDTIKSEETVSLNETLRSELTENFLSLSNKIDILHKTFYRDYRQFSIIIEKLQDSVKKTRLFPIKSVLDVFPRMVRDISVSVKKKVKLQISGGDIELDKYILEEIKDPLMHIIRNCVDHGIELPEERTQFGKTEEGLIQVDVFHKGNNAVIKIMDNGKGMDIEKIKKSAIKKGLYTNKEINEMKEKQILDIIFHPGFSTSEIITDISGRGIGMDVVKTNVVEKLHGVIEIETKMNKGTVFLITLPMGLSVTQALKISLCGKIFFLPVNMVEKIIKVSEKNLPVVEGFPALRYLDSFIPYVRLSSLLEIPEPESSEGDENFKRPVVIIGAEKNRAALGIDLFIGEEEILIKGLGNLMKKVRNISGVTVMRDGNISPILSVADMVKMVQHRGIAAPKKIKTKTDEKETSSILVVDDSIMTRTLQMNIIESYGYNVITAVDGRDALSKVQENIFDLIVSDIQMPNMDGLEFTEKIKSDDRYKKIPVILVTALESEEDKKRGIEVGADAYIIKSSFDQSNLLNTIKRLL